MSKISLFLLINSISFSILGQVDVEGYVYEQGNRGYIANAEVMLTDVEATTTYANTITNESGIYNFTAISPGEYLIRIFKSPFIDHSENVVISDEKDIAYLKHEIQRMSGYVFEITLSEKNITDGLGKGALKGALIEVYNNTKREEHLVISDLQTPDFQVNLIKGNHYTILVRKEGYLSKRMEAFVDVEGCILCFEGVGEITPGVSDNLTESNSMGVLLANVELDKYYEGKVIELSNIYYESNKATLTTKAKEELDNVASFILDNPNISLELGSHTDSRGTSAYNLDLSKRRAQSAAGYLINEKNIPPSLLTFKGYGETNLKNDCDDTANCNESEHAINRRTELKILDIGNTSQMRLLRQMKTEELMDEILADLEKEGQIQISISDEDQIVGEPTDIQMNDLTIDDEFENNTIEMSFNKEKIDQRNIIDKEEIEKDKNVSLKTDIETSGTDLNSTNSNIENGYKIVILFSRYELLKDHPLFERFPELKIYLTADGNRLYMIESFDSKSEAMNRIKTRYKTSYPNAYVVGFENGIIVD